MVTPWRSSFRRSRVRKHGAGSPHIAFVPLGYHKSSWRLRIALESYSISGSNGCIFYHLETSTNSARFKSEQSSFYGPACPQKSAREEQRRLGWTGFETDSVVDGIRKPLFTPEINLGQAGESHRQ
jgi:hypothetical protein